MGSGTVSHCSYRAYATSLNRNYDVNTGRMTGQTYTAVHIDDKLNPRKFKIRECCNSEEHPNTIPVILALDVTGSMGAACSEVAAALGKITVNLFEKFKDVEFCIMGIGDLAYDEAPIQMSQFESDIRIAEALDKLFIEAGGGGNGYESYTAAWYMGLYHTRLDCFDKQNRKGIIITMGDEPLNPYLPSEALRGALGSEVNSDIETMKLFNEAIKKFDIFHIAVDSNECMYKYYSSRIEESFGQLLGKRLKISDVKNLSECIEDCVSEAINGNTPMINTVSENNEISW